MATRAKELSDLGNLKLDVTANGIDVVGVGSNFKSESYNILNLQTDTDDSGSSDDGIFKITNGASATTKAEFRWDESEDLVHVSYGDHGRHISIGSDGKVGIATGSTAPSQTLDVNGTAIAEQYLLDAIDKDISDTAVDVFVYDTSKDSDGGAWRHRTQHTSWYNETLNTATRGSRKEFPSMAVIVLETLTVTIYDADDVDLPMWMVINADNGANGTSSTNAHIDPPRALFHTSGLNCIAMLNGQLNIGSQNWHVFNFDFALDQITTYIQYGSFGAGQAKYSNQIFGRDAPGTYVRISGNGIRAASINDLDMTVYPNTPINEYTQLPQPTVAVATDDGLNVITPNGVPSYIYNNQDSSAFNYVDHIFFRKDGALVWAADSSSNTSAERFVQVYHNLVTSNVSHQSVENSTMDEQYGPRHKTGSYLRWAGTSGVKAMSNASDNTFAVGTSDALHIIAHNIQDENKGSIAHITKNYNTGFMHSEMSLAALSSINSTNATDSNVVTNGSFDSNVTGWYGDSEGQVSWNSSAYADVGNGGGDNTWAIAQSGILTSGTKYLISFSINPNNASNVFRIRAGGSSVQWTESNFTANTWSDVVALVTADGATLEIGMNGGSATSFKIDDITVRTLNEEDRSYQNNGLAVAGTITRNPVATGAELVSYEGWSANNNLSGQISNTIGTGDFSFSMWIKPVSLDVGAGSYFHAIGIGQDSLGGQGSSTGIVLKMTTTSNTNAVGYSPYFYSGNGGDQGTYDASETIPLGSWNQLIGVRDNGVFKMYINGELRKTGVSSTINISDNLVTIGHGGQGFSEYGGDPKLALVRISKSAPTAEQVADMYNAEKSLFQENAKATLYGDTSYVQALAHDTSTDLLHAATGQGRSVFQGLTRVDNTTDGISIALSVSNGLTAEE